MEGPENNFQYTSMMNTALRFINSTGRHIFLTGKAGTGKTTFLKSLSLRTHKQMAIVAPTGIAALNAGGTTIHSQFLLPFGMFIPDHSFSAVPEPGANWYTETVLARKHPLNSVRKQVLRAIDLLIIDEVSMLRADLLDAIDYRLRSVRGNFRQGFGGVQLLLIGDLYQLPPVVKREEESKLRQYYNSSWFFESKGLKRDGFTYIELDQIFRQRDNAFIRVLNNLRVNCPTPEDIITLNEFYRSPDEIRNLREVITLTTHNYKADDMNRKALDELTSASCFFEAVVTDDFPESMYPVPGKLELKVGAQIMFTRNDSENRIYYNGKLATVTHILGDKITVLLAGSDKPYNLQHSVWENKKYRLNETTKDLEDEVTGTFSQFPVKLAWAITVHKSQGLTFDKAIIDVGEAFADGQVYVALSRLTSIDGLILRAKVDPGIVSTDKVIVSFDALNNKPDALALEIKSQQKAFLQALIYRTFDFESVVKEITYLMKDHLFTETLNDDDRAMISTPKQIHDALADQVGNTLKFRTQLRDLLLADNTEDFLSRTAKGQEYYKALLWEQLKVLAEHIGVTSSAKRVKGYLSDLDDLDQLLTRKWEEVNKVYHITETILRDKDDFDLTILNAERDKARADLVATSSKQNAPSKKSKKSGRKKKGSTEASTFDKTITMADRGLSVTQIAEERGLVVSTIEGHLARGVANGKISIYKFMEESTVRTITHAITELPEGFNSKDLFVKLNGKFGYGQLRAVINHVAAGTSPIKA